jgi:hypothetical protein
VSLPFALSLKSEISNNIEAALESGGAVVDNQFRIGYKLNDSAQIGVLLSGKYNIAEQNQLQSDQEFVAGDAAIAGILVAPSLLRSDKTEVDGRLYLPTSEASKKAQQQFQVRADVKLPYTLPAQSSFTVTMSPRVSGYVSTGEKLDFVSQAKLAKGRTIVPYFAMNHSLRMLNGMAGMARTTESVGPEIGVEVSPSKMVRLALLVSQERSIFSSKTNKQKAQYTAFAANETKVLFGAQIRL